jgi:hypothetical protein
MQGSTTDSTSTGYVAIHPLDTDDAAITAALPTATSARESVKLPIEIMSKVAGNSKLIAGGARPQKRSKQSQVRERRKSRRVPALLCYPNEKIVR